MDRLKQSYFDNAYAPTWVFSIFVTGGLIRAAEAWAGKLNPTTTFFKGELDSFCLSCGCLPCRVACICTVFILTPLNLNFV